MFILISDPLCLLFVDYGPSTSWNNGVKMQSNIGVKKKKHWLYISFYF